MSAVFLLMMNILATMGIIRAQTVGSIDASYMLCVILLGIDAIYFALKERTTK